MIKSPQKKSALEILNTKKAKFIKGKHANFLIQRKLEHETFQLSGFLFHTGYSVNLCEKMGCVF